MPLNLFVKLFFGVLLTGALIAIVAANFQRDPEFSLFKWKLNREAPTEVKLSQAIRSKITRTIEAPGKVEADVEVKISYQFVGRHFNFLVKEAVCVKKNKN